MTADRHYKLITFDLDDTLWHVAPVIDKANRKTHDWLMQHCPDMCESWGPAELLALKDEVLRERPTLRHQISLLRIETLRKALVMSGYSFERATDIAQQAFEIFIAARHEIELFDHALECLQQLGKHYILGVLTNGNACVKRLNLEQYFAFVYSAEQLNSSKPDPQHFHAALSLCQLVASQTIHVGDHPEHDIQAAQRLGIKTIWMNWKKENWPYAQEPDMEITNLGELVEAVDWLEASKL